MIRTALIAVLSAAIIVLAHALVRVENERYALWLGMCPNMREAITALASGDDDAINCTKTVQTRTAWWWHIYYAIANKG
ncbi:hypothetical protein [Paraburkholderia tropica]|uniref:hypothetical protein n=1 Tax=Paraburkholderia tropica TaxID=92647 RepID=UPI001CC3A5D1|nr:hypothetical protein [Paraburkholderia tropica]